MSRIFLAGIILLATVVVFGAALLLIKIWSGKPFRAILADRSHLFSLSLKVAIALLVAVIVALVVRNN
jgi:hypothetical protein